MKSKAKERLEQIAESFDKDLESFVCVTITTAGIPKQDCKLVEWHSPNGNVILEYISEKDL